MTSTTQLWRRFQKYYTEFPALGLALDLSRMKFPDHYFEMMEPRMQRAFGAMADLERGAIANPDENRMVGHYWLRNPTLAPSSEIREAIERTVGDIRSFASQVHDGTVSGVDGRFRHLLVIGIGGSALGPQFVSKSQGHPKTNKNGVCVLENTDTDVME